MKLFHLSDLHLGKRVNEFSMLEDQDYILKQILQMVDAEHPDGVMIAGDVYDKPVPPTEAVELLDNFLVQLVKRNVQILMISGNHDSAERVSFGGRLMEQSGVHISHVYNGTIEPVKLTDQYGEVRFYLLPFIKPAHVRQFYPDAEIESYTDAIRVAVEQMNIDSSVRNVILTHQFVTGAERCESEEVSVGGTDNVDASVFDAFDYVALGHIHGPQQITRPTIRYCGTPLKYSFSEAGHKKSVTVVELGEKGNVDLRFLPLVPLHDMREIRGSYMDVTAKSFYEGTPKDDYLHITLTDEEDVPNAMAKLRIIYPNLMKLDYDNARTRSTYHFESSADVDHLSPLDLFAEPYEKQNNQPMSEEQTEFVRELMEQIWEDAQ
jgi:DNA repair protein SbcD/Mre11